jgi:hypothetical protein
MSNRQRMQSDNPLFGQVNPEMASGRGNGNGGEPVSPAAVAAPSTSSSTAHASAAAADPPPPAFVVTRAMKDEALKTAKETARVFGSWSKLSTKQQDTLYKKELTAIVEKQRADGAEARLSARDAAGTLLSLLLLSPVGLVTRLVAGLVAGQVETSEEAFCCLFLMFCLLGCFLI